MTRLSIAGLTRFENIISDFSTEVYQDITQIDSLKSGELIDSASKVGEKNQKTSEKWKEKIENITPRLEKLYYILNAELD